MKELVMSRLELPVLANDIYCGEKRYFRVSYPLYGQELFTLDFRRLELTNIVDRESFNAALMAKRPIGLDSLRLVGFEHFKQSLISSGALRCANEDEVVSWLRKLRERSLDPELGGKQLFMGVDTNILYTCFISRHLGFQDVNRMPFYSGFRYIISDIVREEIDAKVHHKYRPEEIEALRAVSNEKWLVDELRNANDPDGRRAKLAFNECEFLRNELKAIKARGGSTSDKEANDRKIAKAYLETARSHNYEVCMLTADEDMVTHARTCELPVKQLIFPPDPPRHLRLNPWTLQNLLYDLAVSLGAIAVENEEKILILGEWRGKTSRDYSEEVVKVFATDDSRVGRVTHELQACREVRSAHGHAR